jgi:probable addiction module antidote protein
MALKLYPFDPAEALVDETTITIFISDALETGDAAYIAKALDVVARARKLNVAAL